jgi:hypothetical protein
MGTDNLFSSTAHIGQVSLSPIPQRFYAHMPVQPIVSWTPARIMLAALKWLMQETNFADLAKEGATKPRDLVHEDQGGV